MNKMIDKSLAFLIATLFFFGCATTQKNNGTAENQNRLRRQDYVQNHPTLPYDVRNAILNAKVLIGMSKEQVWASWGNPNDTKKVVDISGSKETWFYFSPIRSLTSSEAAALTPAQIAQYYQIANSKRKRIILYFENDKLMKYEE